MKFILFYKNERGRKRNLCARFLTSVSARKMERIFSHLSLSLLFSPFTCFGKITFVCLHSSLLCLRDTARFSIISGWSLLDKFIGNREHQRPILLTFDFVLGIYLYSPPDLNLIQRVKELIESVSYLNKRKTDI